MQNQMYEVQLQFAKRQNKLLDGFYTSTTKSKTKFHFDANELLTICINYEPFTIFPIAK